MTEISELKSWIVYAEEDFSAAKTLLGLKKPLLAAVCFHGQQCAEKYFKALLILKDMDFPKTHDLPTLNTLCNQNGILTGFDPQQLADLTKYAVQARYPGSHPTLEEAKEAIEIAKSVATLAARSWGLKNEESNLLRRTKSRQFQRIQKIQKHLVPPWPIVVDVAAPDVNPMRNPLLLKDVFESQ